MLLLRYKRHLFLSHDPIITAYMGTCQFHVDSRPPDPPEHIRPDISLEHTSWHMTVDSIRAIKKRFENCKHETEYMLIVNTAEENMRRKRIGVSGFLGNAEIYQSEYDFKPDEQSCAYDAIYNARIAPFKRHYLANNIKNVRVLTGGKGDTLSVGTGVDYIDQSNCVDDKDFINKSVCFAMLAAEDVCAEINKSCCGLALSAEEGMMQSSTEYLLCGRPVVSTRSRGGRDVFYNKDNCVIVADDPSAVLEGVQYWVNNPPDRSLIRRTIIAQLNKYRYEYARKISQLILSRGGREERPERIFYDLFISKTVFRRRVHGPGSQITEGELAELLAYPDTEILFTHNPAFTKHDKGDGFYLESDVSRIQLDEISSWISSNLNGQKTVTEIINELGITYGDPELVSEDVRDTIARFIGLGVICIANQTD